MTTPNVKLLKEISQFSSELEVLETKVSALEEERKIKFFVNESKIEDLKSKYIRERKDAIDLDVVKADLSSLRTQEEELRNTLESNINTVVDTFVNGGKYNEFIANLLSKLNQEDSSAKLFVGHEVRHIINLASEEAPNGNQVRIEVKGKIYDLSPFKIVPKLKEKLLIKLLNSN